MSQQQLQQIIQMLKAQPIAGRPTVQETRANFEQMTALFPVAADIKCEPVNAGGVKAEWVTAPGADAGRAVLYLHGGGYVIGSINTHRDLASRISRAAKARVLLIDYRLAPEHPFPAAVEDSVAAYRWMLAQGLKPARIAVAGDSAGGGLTVATLVAIRDAKLASPGAGVCLSPWTDLEGLGDSMKSKASVDPMVNKEALLEMAKHYLAGQRCAQPARGAAVCRPRGPAAAADPGRHRGNSARRLDANRRARAQGGRQGRARAVGKYDPRLPGFRADARRRSAGDRQNWGVRPRQRRVRAARRSAIA